MCGRFTLRASSKDITDFFGIDLPAGPDPVPRYNIAPTQSVLIVQEGAGGRAAAWARWGLIPSWATDQKIGNRLANARGDTIASKPSFRSAYRKRRCLVPADGFYEWQAVGKKKQPYLFQLRTGGLFALAGLWENWRRDEVEVLTFTLITTDANDVVRPVHDRMPVILQPNEYNRWLHADGAGAVADLLAPFPAEQMTATAVSTTVNNARFDGPACVVPLAGA
jgi:putative SOS response-associated peptidase YedK